MSDGERIELREWDLSDEWERYELAFHLSRTHHNRLAVTLLANVFGWMFSAFAAAGLYFQSDPWWYTWDPSAPFTIRAGLELIPFIVLAILGATVTYGLWVRYDAPGEEQIRAMYAAAEQAESVYGDHD